MSLQTLRSWIALCALLVLTLGLGAHSVAVTDMGAKMMTVAASEMSPSSGCGGCGDGSDGMLAAGCFALCGGTAAVLPSAALVKPAALELVAPVEGQSHSGRVGSPDPDPPKPSILS